MPSNLTATLTPPQRTLMAQSLGFIIHLLVRAAMFSAIEDWRFTDAIYWATLTLLTNGFGDIVPVTHTGRSLIIPYAAAGDCLHRVGGWIYRNTSSRSWGKEDVRQNDSQCQDEETPCYFSGRRRCSCFIVEPTRTFAITQKQRSTPYPPRKPESRIHSRGGVETPTRTLDITQK